MITDGGEGDMLFFCSISARPYRYSDKESAESTSASCRIYAIFCSIFEDTDTAMPSHLEVTFASLSEQRDLVKKTLLMQA